MRFSQISACVLLLLTGAFANAGGEVSGGADTYVVLPAFYVSANPSRPITTCIDVSPSFGVPESAVADMLSWAFAQWANYITSRDLTYAINVAPAGIVSTLSGMHSGCAGNEDLRAYFGETPPEVQARMAQFIDPYAFVSITSTAADGLWNTGFLWVAGPGTVNPQKKTPTWNLPTSQVPYGALKYLVLHEVGHIFGNSHVDNTVMEAMIGQTMEGWTDPVDGIAPDGPTQSQLVIDGQLELVTNLNLAEDYALATAYGSVTGPDGSPVSPDPNALNEAFARIFGKKPKGPLSATAHRIADPAHQPHARPDAIYPGTGSLALTFTDGNGAHTARLTTFASISERFDSAPLFNGQHDDHYSSFGMSFSGVIQVEGRKKISVIVNYNMGDRLDVIDFTKAGSEHPLLQVQY